MHRLDSESRANSGTQTRLGESSDNSGAETRLGESSDIEGCLLLADFTAEDTGVVTAEAEAVVHGGVQLARDWFEGCVVQIASRIGIFEVGRWRDGAAADG